MTVESQQLQDQVAELAQGLDVPGVAVGVYIDGTEHYAFHGTTSIEHGLPVDESTLFQFGSTGKTFTATAIMRLVDKGDVLLEAPVRTYVPELKLKDPEVAEKVTVLHLLNHTAGWSGDLMENTGDGDDAIAKYVEKMAEIDQVLPLGKSVSYNNAALSVAGRIIEKVTGKTYEQALRDLIFEPLGLKNMFFFPSEIMTRRFAVGHNQEPDGTIKIARRWAMPRGNSPAGGISSNSADLIAWGKFHLGDGTASDSTKVLSEELLKQMQQPTAEMPGSALGDAVGISWLLRDVNGIRLVSHGGDTLGQHSDFVMIPERNFVISTLTNCGPNGNQFNDGIVKWALENYVGVVDKDPEPLSLSDEELQPYTGRFETIAAIAEIRPGDGHLMLEVEIKPETLKQLMEAGEEVPPNPPPFPLGLLPGDGDRYIVLDGPAKGMKGYFVRSDSGELEAVHVGGRLATRTGAPVSVG
ncbi:MAG TPA: serine hydrolase domain-containing protein [Actinomycetota bacterium]|nr:serine hydrolase domain-containing protein [Actinomycetota bacterium]